MIIPDEVVHVFQLGLDSHITYEFAKQGMYTTLIELHFTNVGKQL